MLNEDKVNIKVVVFDENYNFAINNLFIGDRLDCQIYNNKIHNYVDKRIASIVSTHMSRSSSALDAREGAKVEIMSMNPRN